jgi:hypothetical protein
MLHPMMSSATSAFDPFSSAFRAAVTAAITSSGRIALVLRISSSTVVNCADVSTEPARPSEGAGDAVALM